MPPSPPAPVFVLVHSPSVGPSTWQPVAERLMATGHEAHVPALRDVAAGEPPFWPGIAAAVRSGLGAVRRDRPLVLVAHSNAGLFLPTIREALDHPVAASVFVDAALPDRTGPTPVAPPELLAFLRPLAVNGTLPRWTDWWDEADVAPMFPDPQTRRTVVADQPTLPLTYYEQHVPVPAGWPDHPCSYLLFGPPYEPMAAEARARDWQVAQLPGAHLHQLVDPTETAHVLLDLAAGRVAPEHRWGGPRTT
ncbi:alpha/beta hydrolase [Streptomyces sp. SID14478]|uniref:alpha/beta hydrolase n=1 Tax=Streptomyces sp. SID14478 TaxID=2706073 RepID=UPI0013DBA01F|nr:alpha/beta hydrolase [Streptomyces sp. SID14478]NEB79181.1 alpha/beta hydrolase [Streptomyces sp. SID14478]